MTEKEQLWARIIRSRHGEPRWLKGRFDGGRERGCTGWWKLVTGVVENDDSGWFWDNLVQRVGDGKDFSFWEGLWVGDKTLKEAFPRLYNLSTRKDGLVKDMGEWCEGRWTWKVEWRRRLLDRERALESDLFNLLAAVSLTEGTRDRWEWGNGKGRVFSVKEAYLAITKSFISSTVGRPPAACLNHI